MNKAFLVAMREYLENVRTKGFWIGIMIVPVIYLLMFLVPHFLKKSKPAQKFAVVDQSGWLVDAVLQEAAANDLARVINNARDQSDDAIPQPLADLINSAKDADYRTRLLLGRFVMGQQDFAPDGVNLSESARTSARNWMNEAEVTEWPDLFDGTSRRRYQLVDVEDQDTLNGMVADESLFAYFVIGSDPIQGTPDSKFVSANLTDRDLFDWFKARADAIIRAKRLEQEQIEPRVAQWIQTPLLFEERKVSASGETEEVAAQDRARQWAPMVFVYILWLSIFTIVQMTLTSTIEEKSNRLVEVLLSSMTSSQLMSGKILGIAMTGLTILGTWVGFVLVLTRFLPAMLGRTPDFDLTAIAGDPVFLSMFLAYFLMGYLFYAAILAAIGSVCNSLKEAQTMMSPVIVTLMIPLLIMFPIGQDPNSLLARVLSFIPPFTPFVMMNRAAGPPSTMEYALTTILMLVSIVFAFWAAAKVFRIGILLTGKPPKLSEIMRWLKAPVGAVPEQDR